MSVYMGGLFQMILLNLSLCLLCACCTVAHFCEHFLFWILWVCSYCIKLPVKMARLLIFFLYWVQLLRSNIILKIFIASLIQNIHIAGSVLVTYDLFPNVCIQLIIFLYNSVFWLFINICFSGHKYTITGIINVASFQIIFKSVFTLS